MTSIPVSLQRIPVSGKVTISPVSIVKEEQFNSLCLVPTHRQSWVVGLAEMRCLMYRTQKTAVKHQEWF